MSYLCRIKLTVLLLFLRKIENINTNNMEDNLIKKLNLTEKEVYKIVLEWY